MNPRKPGNWSQAASEFHKRHGKKSFTMTWNKTIETQMMDKSIGKDTRYLACVHRYSWGNLSDFAVDRMPAKNPGDPTPKPLTQKQIAEILGISQSSASEAEASLKDRGYLRKDHPFLYPEDDISLLESEKESGVKSDSTISDSPNLRCEKYFFSTVRPDIGANLSDCDAKRKAHHDGAAEMTRVIRKMKLTALSYVRDAIRKGDPVILSLMANAPTESAANPNVSDVSKTSGDPMRSCAPAQNESEGKANHKSVSTEYHSDGVKSDSNRSQIGLQKQDIVTAQCQDGAKPSVSSKICKGSLKPLTSNRNIAGETTTTFLHGAGSSSSSDPIQSLPIPLDFLDRLARGFAAAGKPVPTRAQITGAYIQVAARWEEFLEWIPNSDEFRRMAHPGGLPTLIGFFLETEPGQPPQRRPIDRVTASGQKILAGLDAIDRMKGRKAR